jgi:hypothetical protein
VRRSSLLAIERAAEAAKVAFDEAIQTAGAQKPGTPEALRAIVAALEAAVARDATRLRVTRAHLLVAKRALGIAI